jgi:hypothetical protein
MAHPPGNLKAGGKSNNGAIFTPSTRYQPKLADKMAKYIIAGQVAPTGIKYQFEENGYPTNTRQPTIAERDSRAIYRQPRQPHHFLMVQPGKQDAAGRDSRAMSSGGGST